MVYHVNIVVNFVLQEIYWLLKNFCKWHLH